MEWYVITLMVLGGVVGVVTASIAVAKWLDDQRKEREESIAAIAAKVVASNTGKIDEVATVVTDLKGIIDRWFPEFDPQDLTAQPRPSVVTTLRDHNHRLGAVEQSMQLMPMIDKDVKEMLVMLRDGLKRFEDIEGRVARLEARTP